ncbi:MAG: zf-HC2 domain-containing protein [Lachnospiraceae bacterium]|nr:zf-HC2 domain-containing protein [Lachnospiraceae bacterium]
MKCEDINRYIPAFIEDRLVGTELSSFLSHVRDCPSCYEEMETSFLISESLSRLEDGGSFDIHSELISKLENYENCVNFHNSLTLFRRVVLIIAGFCSAACFVWWII